MEEWRCWCSDLVAMKQLRFPRLVGGSQVSSPWQIHVYCDASLSAYGACAYLRIQQDDETVSVNLIFAKSRVAPLKALSLPRLELMAALIGARMAACLQRVIVQPTTIYFWSDSTIALSWIRSPAKNWKPFVQNRVREIQNVSDPESWRHCPGTDNPADYLTRGMKAEALLASRHWWHGPAWLARESAAWPMTVAVMNDSGEAAEIQANTHGLLLEAVAERISTTAAVGAPFTTQPAQLPIS